MVDHMNILNIPDSYLDRVQWGNICSPKTGGIRCITGTDGTPYLTNGKPVPNNHIRNSIKEYGVAGLDGEVVVDCTDVIDTASTIRDFKYVINDIKDTNLGYFSRMQQLCTIVPSPRPKFISLVATSICYNAEGAREYWNKCALDGAYGIYIRRAGQDYLSNSVLPYSVHIADLDWCEYSKWKTSVATIIGFNEGKESGELESLLVSDFKMNKTFCIESGFTLRERKNLWANQAQYNKFKVDYKYQPVGDGVPATPVFVRAHRR